MKAAKSIKHSKEKDVGVPRSTRPRGRARREDAYDVD